MRFRKKKNQTKNDKLIRNRIFIMLMVVFSRTAGGKKKKKIPSLSFDYCVSDAIDRRGVYNNRLTFGAQVDFVRFLLFRNEYSRDNNAVIANRFKRLHFSSARSFGKYHDKQLRCRSFLRNIVENKSLSFQ